MGIVPPTHGVPGAANVVCGSGRARTFDCQKYKTKNNNYFCPHGYQICADHTISTCITRKEGHNPAATKENIMGGDTWVVELI
jgi:hypothetical protein